VENEEAEADAHQEIVSEDSSLEDSFSKLERSSTVEEELKALKQKMGKSDA
jgi:phage shock protein A